MIWFPADKFGMTWEQFRALPKPERQRLKEQAGLAGFTFHETDRWMHGKPPHKANRGAPPPVTLPDGSRTTWQQAVKMGFRPYPEKTFGMSYEQFRALPKAERQALKLSKGFVHTAFYKPSAT